MFIAVSFASLMSTILLEAAKFIGGRAAGDFLFKRIKKKLKKDHKIDVDEVGISEEGLNLFREILQEELQAFGIDKKEIDLLIIQSVQKLSDEHGVIMKKMETIESLLVELTTGLLYDAHVGLSDVPIEVGERLFERYLIGDDKAETKIEEYVEDEHFSENIRKSMERYKPIQEAYQHEEVLVKRFLRHFESEKEDQINQLAVFAEIWAIIGNKYLQTNKILESITFKLLKKISETEDMDLSNLLRFLHLLDITGSLNQLDYDVRSQIILFLKVNLNSVPYYTRMELAYFLMKFSVNEPEVMDAVTQAFEELSKQNYSDKFVKESVSVNKRILSFFKKKTAIDTDRAIQVIKSLTRRFERRKFSRSTALLEGQLTRTLSETNLLTTQIDEKIDEQKVNELKETVIGLVDSLIDAKDKKGISNEHRLQVWKIIDNCVYILNRIAIKNTKQVLESWELDLAKKSGLYSKDWGEYRRQSSDEIEKTVKRINLSESFVKKVELEKKLDEIEKLPVPPSKEKEKEKREKTS